MTDDSTLCNVDPETVPLFSLQGQVIRARVVDVYDGDTLKAIFILPGTARLVKMSCRLRGIDAPEIRPRKSIEGREEVMERARASRKRLCGLVCNTPDPRHNTEVLTLECGPFDKYGRLLVRVVCRECVVNDVMIDEGWARAM